MENSTTHASQHDVESKVRDQYVPIIEEVAPASAEETKAYFSQLKKYFITGEKTGKGLEIDAHPIRLALQIRQDNLPLGINQNTAFQMLNLENKRRGHLKIAFLKKIKKVITGLEELLLLHGDTSKLSNVQMDFAEDLISFDKLRDIAVSGVSSQMPRSRLKRLRAALYTLTTAQESYARSSMMVFASEAVIQTLDLERIFDPGNLVVASENSCRQANLQSEKKLDEFVRTIAALRIGTLMIEQKYTEELHDHYFDQFDLTYLTKEDVKYLPPILVIEDSRQLMLQVNAFLRALSRDSFVKVLGYNHVDNFFDLNNHGEPDYLELASTAIFRRSSYVFQGGIDGPAGLTDAYKKGLEFPGAAFWNVLIPSEELKDENYFRLRTAVESRFFPRIEYEANGSHFVGNEINLQSNPSPAVLFASYEQQLKSPSAEESWVLEVTMADFLALDVKLRKTLEIIPPIYQIASFTPLSEYLSQQEDLSSNKIPFIWLVDNQNKLRQAAIPLSWIQQCRNRLEYWRFLQSVSGVDNAHLQKTIEKEKQEWESSKDTEIEALESALHQQFEKERTDDLRKAIFQMLYILLNEGNDLEGILTTISKDVSQPVVEAEQQGETTPAQKIEEKEEVAIAVIREEVWVETEDCTSCKDCIDALPAVFKYNDNKQAYVHNPKGGTFAQIVKAAEKCPARCIHPGVPQNKAEQSLEKWMERAAKFN